MKSIIVGIVMCTVCFWVFRVDAAERLLYENFDDGILDPAFIVYGGNWAVLAPPQYNLDAVGRGGVGRAFASGTVSEAHLVWRNNVPSPWPTNELYASFWMRYPTFTKTDANENFKVFYPHWNGTQSYVHYSATGPNTIYYSAKANGSMIEMSNYISCPNMMDGEWHHYEFYVNFLEGISRFWYDGNLKLDHTYGLNVWVPYDVYYVAAPSIDAEETGVFSREVDDWEVWDGMPDAGATPPPPAEPSPPGGIHLE